MPPDRGQGTLRAMAPLRLYCVLVLSMTLCAVPCHAQAPVAPESRALGVVPASEARARENAWTYLLEAKAAHKPPNADERKLSSQQQRALVEANTAVFALITEALKHPQRFPDQDLDAIFPSFASLRSIARLYTVRARVQVLEGDLQGAIHSSLDMVALGIKLQEDGPSPLTGLALEGIARQSMEETAQKLNAALLEEAARGLHERAAKRPALGQVLRNQRRFSEAFLQRILEGRPVEGMAGEGPLATPQARRETLALWREATERDHALYAQPYALLQSVAPAELEEESPDEDEEALEAPPGLENREVQQAWVQALVKQDRHANRGLALARTRSQAQSALLEVALALRSYRLRHGAWPETLHALTPTILPALPGDPFELDGPLLFQRQDIEGKTVLLYSIGPDGLDDGGIEIEKLITVRATGDILAPKALLTF